MSCLNSSIYPTGDEKDNLNITLEVLIAVYIICLVFTVHNLVKYIIIHGRWRIILMIAFYILMIALIITRILSLIFFRLLRDGHCRFKEAGDEFDTISTYCKAILGV